MTNPMRYERKLVTRAEQQECLKECWCIMMRYMIVQAAVSLGAELDLVKVAMEEGGPCPMCDGEGVVTLRRIYECWPDASADRLKQGA
jgi:hypothetical protein